jgi:hypothetical protein
MARQARAAPQQAREASPEKASTQSLDEGGVIGIITSNGIPAAASFFSWNCTLQDVTSQASHISALCLIASGK